MNIETLTKLFAQELTIFLSIVIQLANNNHLFSIETLILSFENLNYKHIVDILNVYLIILLFILLSIFLTWQMIKKS